MIHNTFLKTLPAFGLATSVAFGAFSGIVDAQANIPHELIYEGRMLSTSGNVLQGNYIVRLSFWMDSDYTSADINSDGLIDQNAEGFSGWIEELPVVFDSQGYFSLVLGQMNALDNLSFDQYKYLQIEVKQLQDPDTEYTLLDINGENGQDTTDRKMIASVPYARYSEFSDASSNETFILDPNGTASSSGENITLQFGGNLNEYLEYNTTTSTFEFSNSLSVQGGLLVKENIELRDGSTVDGVDISDLSERVSQNTSDITDLEEQTLQNTSDIVQNTSDITVLEAQTLQNASDILQNTLRIGINTDSITAVEEDVLENASRILENTAEIVLNKNDIIQLNAQVLENSSDILENHQDLETLEVQVVENALNILENTEVLNALQTDILQNASDIALNRLSLQELESDLEESVRDLESKIEESGNSTPGDFLLDSDNSGGNITLQFGDVLGETLQWNAFTNMFELSDDLFVDGNIQTSGTINGVNIQNVKQKTDENTIQISQNTQGIMENEARINVLEDSSVRHDQSLSEHSSDIQQLEVSYQVLDTQVDSLRDETDDNTESITLLRQNVADHENILDDINSDLDLHSDTLTSLEIITSQLRSDFLETQNDVLELQISVLENTNTITEREADILENAADILLNTQALSVTDQNVLNNAVLIAQNSSDIEDLEDDVQTNAQDILQNTSDILANAQGLSQAQQDIITNAQAIAQNASDILANVQDIIEIKAEQINQANDISQLSIDTAQNTAFINNLQSAVSDLEESIVQAEQERRDMQSAITQNTSDLDDHDQLLSDLEVRVSGNTDTLNDHAQAMNILNDNIQDVHDRVGSAEYSSENIISEDQTLTEAVSALDAHLGTPQGHVLQIPLGTASLRSDGTNNKVNVYQSTEQSGNNPRHYYKIVSKKSSLQDIDIQFKILLPEHIQTVDSLSLEYQTQGDSTDSSLDIMLTDERGNSAFVDTGLSSLPWETYSPSFAPGYSPSGGEYIFLTIRGYSKDRFQARFGDIILRYTQ